MGNETHGSAVSLERRRLRAMGFLKQGMGVREIARRLRVAAGSHEFRDRRVRSRSSGMTASGRNRLARSRPASAPRKCRRANRVAAKVRACSAVERPSENRRFTPGTDCLACFDQIPPGSFGRAPGPRSFLADFPKRPIRSSLIQCLWSLDIFLH